MNQAVLSVPSKLVEELVGIPFRYDLLLNHLLLEQLGFQLEGMEYEKESFHLLVSGPYIPDRCSYLVPIYSLSRDFVELVTIEYFNEHDGRIKVGEKSTHHDVHGPS